jgi:hypothetical protein
VGRRRRTRKRKLETEETFLDWNGEKVMLYKSALAGHILKVHPDIFDHLDKFGTAIKKPETVVRDRYERNSVWVNYPFEEEGKRYYLNILVTEKGKVRFIRTAFVTDKGPKRGKKIWPPGK